MDRPGRPGATVLEQVRLEVLQDARSWSFLVFGVGIPVAIYLGYLATGIGNVSGQPVGGIAWPAYLMISMAAFGAMNAGVAVAAGRGREEPARRPAGPAPAGSRRGRPSLAVSAISAMVLALPPMILVGLAAALGGLRLAGVDWVVTAALLWLGTIPFVALGLLLGPILDDETGGVVLLGALVLLAIIGGFFQPIDTFPHALAAIAQVLPSYHLADLGRTAVAGHAEDPGDVLVLAAYTLVIGAIVVWRNRSRDKPDVDR